MKIGVGLAIIGMATFLSFLIANIPTGSDPGLAGLILLFWPQILGFVSAIIFLFICAITKNKKLRVLSCLLMASYLIYVGLGLFVDNGWPLILI